MNWSFMLGVFTTCLYLGIMHFAPPKCNADAEAVACMAIGIIGLLAMLAYWLGKKAGRE